MTLSELIEAFDAGKLDKADFIGRANAIHSRLYDYPTVLANSDVTEIRLDESEVAFYISSLDLWLTCPPGESRVAPVEMLNFHTYEPEETRVILALFTDGMVIFDIGANIGWYSMLLARQNRGAAIHAFEPLPYFNAFLKKNIERNGLQDVIQVHPIGFSNESRSVEIFMEKGNATNASMRNVAGSSAATSVIVDVTELDAWCAEQDVEPDFIKCDVEGAELLVMQGAHGVLCDTRPIIFLEMLRKWTKPYGYHPNDLIGLLAGFGYDCHGIGDSGVRRVACVDEDTDETNYVFLHREAHACALEHLAEIGR